MLNILLVDHAETIHKIVGNYLNSEGYRMLSAYDGEEALVRLDDLIIDVMIISKELPIKSGLETLKEIRANAKHMETPVIMITSSSDKDLEEELIESGANALIAKPFKKGNLLEIISDIIKKCNIVDSSDPSEKNLRKEPRINVEDYFALHVIIKTPDQMEPSEVIDISKTGLKFINTDSCNFETGDIIPARLYMNHKIYVPVQLKVVRQEKDGIACEINKPKTEKKNPLDSFIEFLESTKDHIKTEDMGMVIDKGTKKIKKLHLKKK